MYVHTYTYIHTHTHTHTHTQIDRHSQRLFLCYPMDGAEYLHRLFYTYTHIHTNTNTNTNTPIWQGGLYMLAAQDIFARINAQADTGGGELGVSVSFFEIYGGKLFDLLSDRKPLVKREDG